MHFHPACYAGGLGATGRADDSFVSRALQGLILDEARQIVQATEVKTGVLPWRRPDLLRQ
ncbi:MAG: hypothetical protein ACUVSF_04620 [Anaerolineae bacterium]